jgi:bacterioferritin-associated ferredoxin
MGLENRVEKKQFKVNWPGHDEIYLEYCPNSLLVTSLKVKGCLETVNKFKYLAQTCKTISILTWPIPTEKSHSDMLIRELLLKVRGLWDFPYKDEELCHCRLVPTVVVDQAVLAGAHTTPQIIAATGAGSACSACQVNIDKITQYRLKSSA